MLSIGERLSIRRPRLQKILRRSLKATDRFSASHPPSARSAANSPTTANGRGDPSRQAIIIGTVDLIGSALLFSGYRSSFKQRPLHAGLLGQDSLLVLDEAHLSKPFKKLVTSICSFQSGHGTPMKVIRMSATSGDSVNRKAVFASIR